MTTLTDETVAGTGIKLGITLYSLSNEWVDRVYTLDSLLKRVSEAGVGPGVEIVGFQSIRSFPDVDEEFVTNWRSALDGYGLVGSCLGSNIDVALRRDRWLSTEESTDYLARQIEVARRLGFPVLRIQMGATPEVIRAVEPIAARAGVKLGMEIHAPEGGSTPNVARVIDVYDELDSEYLGFIPDFSSTMHTIPTGMVDLLRRSGMTDEHLELLRTVWLSGGSAHERYALFREQALDGGAPRDAVQRSHLIFTMFGLETVESWKPVLDRTIHVHGKFYDVADGVEPSIDYERILGLLVDADYRGFISSEWEGHGFRETGEVDPIELIQRHHELERRALAKAASLR